MPDNASIVTDWLRSKPERFYCPTCITENTGVGPTAQVNRIVSLLAQAKEWRYTSTLCDGCGRSRKCIKLIGT